MRGCESPGRVKWGDGDLPPRDRCPMTILRRDRPDQYDADAGLAVRVARQSREHGTLWNAGGLGDQPVRLMDAVDLVTGEWSRFEEQQHQARMKAAKAKGRG